MWFFRITASVRLEDPLPAIRAAERLFRFVQEKLSHLNTHLVETTISVEGVHLKVEGEENESKKVYITWNNEDEPLGNHIYNLIQGFSRGG